MDAASLEDRQVVLRASVRRRWLVLGVLLVALAATGVWSAQNVLAPLRGFRERSAELCRAPRSPDEPAIVRLAGLTPLEPGAARERGPIDLVDTERAVFALAAGERARLLADRCHQLGAAEDP